MNLVYILNHYSENEASHFHHIINLLDELAKNGVNIKLIIEKPSALPKFRSKIEVVLQKRTNKILRLIELFFILKNITQKGYDKIFIRISCRAALVATLIAKIYPVKVYFWLSGTTIEFDKSQPLGIKKLKWYFDTWLPVKIVLNHNTLVTGPESMGKYYQKWFNIDPSRVIILYNDVDIHRFVRLPENKKKELKAKLGYDSDTQIILSVKRLSPVRGVMYYFPFIAESVVSKLNGDFVFIIIGDGGEEDKLRAAIKESGLNKYFKILGSIPNKNIHEHYMAADIFINPTLAEGFPRVLIEAMACGLPIVTTDAGGIKDIVGEEQKMFVVEKEDRESFVSKLLLLYNDKEKQKLLSDESINLSRKYSTEEIAKMYIRKIFTN